MVTYSPGMDEMSRALSDPTRGRLVRRADPEHAAAAQAVSRRPLAAVNFALLAKLFPALLLLCNVGAAGIAFSHKDWQRGVYWLASAVCIGCVAW
jgi:hypothetical protein